MVTVGSTKRGIKRGAVAVSARLPPLLLLMLLLLVLLRLLLVLLLLLRLLLVLLLLLVRLLLPLLLLLSLGRGHCTTRGHHDDTRRHDAARFQATRWHSVVRHGAV